MKKIAFSLARAFAITALTFTIGCNSGESTAGTSDTAQPVPGTDDSVPGVVNPGHGDTTNATVQPPTTNDNNAIMPNDSTTINQ